MPVETNPAGIWELDPNYPDGATETGATLDNYMRVRLQALLDTFPNVAGAVTPTHTELNYVDGVTSAIQTQLNGKSSTSHTHASTDLTDTEALTYNADTDVSGNAWVLDEDDFASDSATKLATQQSIKAYIDAAIAAVFTPAYTSIERAVDVLVEVETGLAQVPKLFTVVLRCKTTDAGYEADDEVLLAKDDAPSVSGVTIYANASRIGFRTSSTAAIRVANKATGTMTAITAANWRLVFRAWS